MTPTNTTDLAARAKLQRDAAIEKESANLRNWLSGIISQKEAIAESGNNLVSVTKPREVTIDVSLPISSDIERKITAPSEPRKMLPESVRRIPTGCPYDLKLGVNEDTESWVSTHKHTECGLTGVGNGVFERYAAIFSGTSESGLWAYFGQDADFNLKAIVESDQASYRLYNIDSSSYFGSLVKSDEASIWGYKSDGYEFKAVANASKASLEAYGDSKFIIISTEDLTNDDQPLAKFREVMGGDMKKRFFLCTDPGDGDPQCEDLADPLVRNIYAQYIGSHPHTGPCVGSETYVDFAKSFIQVATDGDPSTKVTVEPNKIWVFDIDQSLSVESHAINIVSSAGSSKFSDTYLHVSRNTGAYASFDGAGWLEVKSANGDTSYLKDRLTISSGNFSGSSELWAGTLKLYGGSSSSSIILEHASSSAEINMSSSLGSVYIRTADLTGTKTIAKFRQVKVCVNDEDKTAWVLMTEPE